MVYSSNLNFITFQLYTFCRQLKLYADDGKQYLSDVIDENDINRLRSLIHNSKNPEFEKWINGSMDPIDEQSICFV